jgi:hypothetical protein
MLPVSVNYEIWPSVVPADKEVEMTIAPAAKAFLLFEGKEYTIKIISINSDELTYKNPQTHKVFTAVAHDGIIKFNFTFAEEQEHIVILYDDEEKLLREMRVYSLYEDLYALTPLMGDFHGHSYRSDGKHDPCDVISQYREQGYDFFTLTDHNRFYPGGEIDETFDGVKLGITRVTGEEVHTPGSVVHIVHAGGNESVAKQYFENPEKYEAEVAECEKRVPANIPEQYAARFAKAMWATEKIHEAGGLAIFAHPFWCPGNSKIHNVCYDFARIFLRSGLFDAYELIGGMTQPGNNRSVAMWADMRAEEGLKIPVVGSSDVHGMEKAYTFPHYFTICFASANENDAIIEAVKSFNSVAVEDEGVEYNRLYRAYGSYRLVTYAQYLLKNYFPRLRRLCQGEGVAMRAYSIGDADASLIEAQVKQTEGFKARFFGKAAPVVPTKKIIDFENKWREVQMNGPKTKGSNLTYEGKPTMQI